MAHIRADRVRDTTTTTGTGAITVSGTAPAGFRTLSAVCGSSDTFYYTIESADRSEWEVGRGTYSGSNQFARTSVIASSNSNTLVNFSSGTKSVLLVLHSGELGAFDGFYDARLSGLVANGSSDDRAALAAADTAAVALGAVLVLPPGNIKISSNITVASPILHRPGAILKPDSGIIVTLSSPPQATQYQHLYDCTSGGIVRGKFDVSVCWFGADPTGSAACDDFVRDALESALHSTEGAAGFYQNYAVIYPAGRFLQTGDNTWGRYTVPYAQRWGPLITGAGKGITTITYRPAASSGDWHFYDGAAEGASDGQTGAGASANSWLRARIQDMRIVYDSSACSGSAKLHFIRHHFYSGFPNTNFHIVNVDIVGAIDAAGNGTMPDQYMGDMWKTEGSGNTSETYFDGCYFRAFRDLFWSDNDQTVNVKFTGGTHADAMGRSWLHFTKGGQVNIFGLNAASRYYSNRTYWTASASVSSGDSRWYDGRRYTAGSTGTTGATPPTHLTGAVSDGTITWTYQEDGASSVVLIDATAANIVGAINLYGIRPELGDDNRLLRIQCSNSSFGFKGVLNFHGLAIENASTIASPINAVIIQGGLHKYRVNFYGCSLAQTGGANVSGPKMRVIPSPSSLPWLTAGFGYPSVSFDSGDAFLPDNITFDTDTRLSITANNVKNTPDYTITGSHHTFHHANAPYSERRLRTAAFFMNPWQSGGQGSAVSIVLPPGAFIAGIKLHKQASGANTTALNYRVRDGNSVVLATSTTTTGAGDSGVQVINADISPLRRVTTTNERTLTLEVVPGSAGGGTFMTERAMTASYAFVEYY